MEELPPKPPIIPGTIGVAKSFSNKPLPIPTPNYFIIGDEFTIPDDFSIYEVVSGNRCIGMLKVRTQYGEYKNFHPGYFIKRVLLYDEEYISKGEYAFNKGTAVDFFKSELTKSSLSSAVNALRGKKLKISNIEIVKVILTDNNGYKNYPILTIDLVD